MNAVIKSLIISSNIYSLLLAPTGRDPLHSKASVNYTLILLQTSFLTAIAITFAILVMVYSNLTTQETALQITAETFVLMENTPPQT